MLCTTAINTSNTIRTQTGAAERWSSGLDTNSCYYVITIAVYECCLIKLLPCISFEKYTYMLALEMASPGNRHCANCIGALSFCRTRTFWRRGRVFLRPVPPTRVPMAPSKFISAWKHPTSWPTFIFNGFNVFFAPKNLWIDTKIIKFVLIVTQLWSFRRFGGHLGRHLEKKHFRGSHFGKLLTCYKVH